MIRGWVFAALGWNIVAILLKEYTYPVILLLFAAGITVYCYSKMVGAWLYKYKED